MQSKHPLEHLVPPPIVTLLTAAGMWGIAHVTSVHPFHHGWRDMMAYALCGLGLAVTVTGVATFARAGTTINPVEIDRASSLVTGGIFRYTRNPMYLGMLLILIGFAVWLSSPAAALGAVAFVVYITRFQIIPEERSMHTLFGSTFDEYRQRTRRWI